MNTEIISTNSFAGKPIGSLLTTIVLENELQDVLIEFISIKGNYHLEESAHSDVFDVLLTIYGEGVLQVDNTKYEISSSTIARIPYNREYSIRVEKGKEFYFLRLRKLLDDDQVDSLSQFLMWLNRPPFIWYVGGKAISS